MTATRHVVPHRASIPTIAIFAALAFCQQLFAIQQERASGVHGERGCVGFDHHVDGHGPDHRHVEQQMPPPRRRLYERQPLAFHQARRAAQHGVRPFHRFERHAGAFGDGDALAEIEARERMGDLPAVFDVVLFVGIGFAFRNRSSRREQRLQQESGIDQVDSFIRQHFGDAADQRIRVLMRQSRQHFDQPPVRRGWKKRSSRVSPGRPS